MRVLFCGEASFLKSGYAIYGKNLISRIHATSGFEVAEFANYASSKDKRVASVPWKMYCNLPETEEEKVIYEQNKHNHFGAWKFERVCLDFKPDVVVSYLDSWMMKHQANSPYRPFYKLVWMPAVDAAPQNIAWLNMYSQIDGVFGYTDWGLDVLKEESGGLIKTVCSAHYCAEEAYKPVFDKEQHKTNIGLGGTKIIGFISRNQKRKLFPDLFAAFRQYIDTYKRYDTMLYCHTTFPDGGWDIPQLLKDTGLTNKVLFTYICKGCGKIKPSVFHDAGVICEECGKIQVIANFDASVPPDGLAQIINCFDVYIHYANSEAWGMAQIESAACGVPVMGVDYAGMSDIIAKIGGIPLKPKGFSKEIETGCLRAIPDNDDLVNKLNWFFSLPYPVRVSMGNEVRANFEKYYQWEAVVKSWIDYISSITVEKGLWYSNPRIFPVPDIPTNNMTDAQFARWLMTDVLRDQTKVASILEAKIIRNLSFGIDMESYPLRTFSREDAYNIMRSIAENRNAWEEVRLGIINAEKEAAVNSTL